MIRLVPLVACLAVATPAHAGRRPLVITSGTVASALSELSAQTGISVSVEDRSLWTRRVAGFSAALAPGAALRRILGTAGARPVKVGPAAYRATSSPIAVSKTKTSPAPTLDQTIPEGEVV